MLTGGQVQTTVCFRSVVFGALIVYKSTRKCKFLSSTVISVSLDNNASPTWFVIVIHCNWNWLNNTDFKISHKFQVETKFMSTWYFVHIKDSMTIRDFKLCDARFDVVSELRKIQLVKKSKLARMKTVLK